MKIGNIEFRKPWTRYVDIPIEDEIFYAVRKSIVEDIIKLENEDGNLKTDFLIKYTKGPKD